MAISSRDSRQSRRYKFSRARRENGVNSQRRSDATAGWRSSNFANAPDESSSFEFRRADALEALTLDRAVV